MAIGEKGLYSTVDKGIERPKMQVDNFGVTPAKNVFIWRKIVDLPPDFLYSPEVYSRGEFLVKNAMIHPGQQLPLFWADNMTQREGKFVFGYIQYSDIYNQRWKFRFAYQHRREAWYTLHDTHNDEISVQG